MITLVKFLRNRDKTSDNYLVTRTLGKVGVIKREVLATLNPAPQHDEFWYVEILNETNPGKIKGCWLLRPLKKIGTVDRRGILEPDVIRLIPGTFDIDKRSNTIYVYPRESNIETGPNWILDGDVRGALTAKYKAADGSSPISSVIVVFGEKLPPPIVTPPPEGKPALDPIIDLEAMAKELEQHDE